MRNRLLKFIHGIAQDIKGATAIEYGLIAALVVIGAMIAFFALGDAVTALFNYVSNSFVNAAPT